MRLRRSPPAPTGRILSRRAGGTIASVNAERRLTRRSFLLGAAGLAVTGLIGCTRSRRAGPSTRLQTQTVATPADCDAADGGALWETAIRRGLVYGSSAATWQLEDAAYRRLFADQAAILFTEDDLLWWRLRPTPRSDLDFSYGDRIIRFAERQGLLVFGAHLVWDQGFGEGWTDDDLWNMDEATAREVLFGTLTRTVRHYRGRVAAWSVANEVMDGSGLRVDVPWYLTIGSGYVAEAFRLAHEADPEAHLVLNEFGYETDDSFALAADKRRATLEFLDDLLAADVPVHALGIQAHLHAEMLAESFDPEGYRRFLSEVADRGLEILITELDVLDDGLPADIEVRDRAVADAIRRYLDVALDEPALVSLMTFGLSDRYTWLEEDYPREDRAPRRPLPFDEDLRPKPAYGALQGALAASPAREPLWVPRRC